MFSRSKIAAILDGSLVLFLMTIYFLYSHDPLYFPKIYVELPFYNFPIFIGEILLGVTILFWIGRLFIKDYPEEKWHILLLLFYIFIIFKTLIGYLNWGPLAFRHMAMFNYLWFALIAAYVYRRGMFNQPIMLYGLYLIFTLFFVARLIKSIHAPGMDYHLSYLIFAVIVALQFQNKYLRLLGVFTSLVLAIEGYELASRGVLLSFAGAFLFFSIVYLFNFLRVRLSIKLLYVVVLIVVFFLWSSQKSEKTCFDSLFYVKEYVSSYLGIREYVQKNKDVETVAFKEVVLFIPYKTPEQLRLEKMPKQNIALKKQTEHREVQTSIPIAQTINSKSTAHEAKEVLKQNAQIFSNNTLNNVAVSKETQVSSNEKANDLQVSSNQFVDNLQGSIPKPHNSEEEQFLFNRKVNVIWRLMLWGDALEDLIKHKKIIGFDLGYPFRSKTVEIYRTNPHNTFWTAGDWVGWLDPHNGYINIIYRIGILGLLLITLGIILYYQMLKFFCKHKDLTGILLLTSIFYWLLFFAFEAALELPYLAIPFWILFGLTIGYYRSKNVQLKGN